MPFIVTAHRAVPGLEDAYEDFLAQRKLGFVRSLPGVTRYDVYRRGQLFGPFGQSAPEPRFDVVAVMEVEDVGQLGEVAAGREYQEFRREYAPWIEHHPGIYVCQEVEQRAALSREEYWSGAWPELVSR